MKGCLILIRNSGIVSKLIRKLTHSEWNHVGIFENNNHIIESTFRNGVVRTKFINFLEEKKQGKIENFDIYKIKDITEDQKNIMVQFIIERIGHKYDFFQFICLGLMLLVGLTRKIEPIDDTNKWLCSELIAEGAYQAGIKFHENIDPDNITPGDIVSSKITIKIE